jgi:hypothetical protein
MQVSEDARRSILVLTEADQGNLGGLVAFRACLIVAVAGAVRWCGRHRPHHRTAPARHDPFFLCSLIVTAPQRSDSGAIVALGQHFVGVGSFRGGVCGCGIGELL